MAIRLLGCGHVPSDTFTIGYAIFSKFHNCVLNRYRAN
jgi:hypothetical protein